MNLAHTIRAAALLLALAIGGWLTAIDRTHDATPEGPVTPARVPPPIQPFHGLAIQIHSAHDAGARHARLIDEIADLGADSVLISVNGYQEHVDSTRIFADPSATPTNEQLAALFAHAHARGLRVILMPKILLSDPRGNNWRGKIQPPSWDAWFDQYRAFMLRYANLAQRCRVEVLIVGSELISTENLTHQWRETIRQVRGAYPGLLAYSANWDHYTAVQFWDALDLLGMTTYYQLADQPGPSIADLTERWRALQERILEFQRTVNRPLLFTEVGWCSQEGCSIEAWNYYRASQATPAGLEEQRRNYAAFIAIWTNQPAVGGLIWWEWTESPGGPLDCGYTPRGKPAESNLRRYFQALRDPLPE